MKAILKIALLLFWVQLVNAQTPTGVPTIKSPGWAQYRWLGSDSGNILPVRDTNWIPRFPTEILWPRLGIDTAMWQWTGKKWQKNFTKADSSQFIQGAWTVIGNTGTNSLINFLGTIDSNRMYIRTNNVPRIQIEPNAGQLYLMPGGVRLRRIQGTQPGGISFTNDVPLGNALVVEQNFQLLVNTQNTQAGNNMAFRSTASNSISGVRNHILIENTFAPPSGDAEYNAIKIVGSISQIPVGATGISRGILIADTATQAADYRALEVKFGRSLFHKTVSIYDTTQSNNVISRSLYVGGSMGINKDSVPSISNINPTSVLMLDTTTGLISKTNVSNIINTLTASNGLSRIGNDFRLGGALSSNTDIRFNSNDLHLAGAGRLFVDTGRIVVGVEVDPLYPLSVKKIYDNVTQSNFSTTVAKYPLYADKDVRFTQDSVSFNGVGGDNAGLNILRYKAMSALDITNTVNRFTGAHSVLSLEKYPGFADTTIYYGRTSPFPAAVAIPSGYSAILGISGGTSSTAPVIGKGWFAAFSTEVQTGNSGYNKLENAIWIHAGGGTIGANTVTNGYALYINGFSPGVTNKYAIYQQGTADSVYLAGKLKIPNLTVQADSALYKPVVKDANGNIFSLSYWPVGSGGGGGVSSFSFTDGSGFDGTVINSTTTPTLSLTTSLTTASIPFIGSSGALSQDNTNFNFDNTNKRVSITAGISPAAKLHINTDALGGNAMLASLISSGILLSNTTAAANNSQQASPYITFRANGWGTTAGTSQTVDWRIGQLPVQGATPTSNFLIGFSNGGAFNSAVSISAGGTITAGSYVASTSVTAGSTGQFNWSSRSAISSLANGSILLSNSAVTDFGLLQFGGSTASFPALQRSGINLIARLSDNSANTDIEVLDEVYGISWNGSNEVPTKNSVYDKIETISPGVSVIGAILDPGSLSKSTNGAVISGTSLYMQSADVTYPGLITASAQTIGGIKTFANGIITQTTSSSVAKLSLTGNISGSAEPGVFGSGLSIASYTYTDGGASRTVSNIQQMNKISSPTLEATNAVTYTTAANLYVMKPTAGTNLTITQNRSIFATGISHMELMANGVFEGSSSSVSMEEKGHYIFIGTTATYTLPDRNSYFGAIYFVKNAGSGILTVQRGGSDQIYDTSVVTSIAIAPGEARIIIAGSNYWYVE